ncbi:MAG: hypothetical protein DRN06_06305 [Thermoprotei archaeon]|nr:MAG: hypothetical protein DRN06_06305 [Thermoprotei archaeon]
MTEDAVARIAKGSSLLLLGQLISNLIAVGAFMVIARGMSKAEMGIAAVTNLLITLGVILSGAGVPVSSIRFISESRGTGSDYRPLIMASILTRAMLTTLYSAVLMIFAGQIASLLLGSASNVGFIYLAIVAAIFAGFMNTLNNALIGLNRMLAVCLSYIFSASVGYSVSVLLVIKGWGAVGYILGWVASGLAGSIVSGIFLAKAVSLSLNEGKTIVKAMRTLIAFSVPVLITNLATYAFNCFDMFVLVGLASQEELGMYSVAKKAFSVITMIPVNVAMALFPYYGERYGREELDAIRAATAVVSRYLSLLYIPIALGLSALAEPILIIFAGEKYAGSTPMLMIFGFFGALTAFVPVMGYLLITYGKTKHYMAANLASISCALSLIPLLIPRLGALTSMALIRGVALMLLLIFYTLSTRNMASTDYQTFIRSLTGSTLMALLVYLLQTQFHRDFLLPLYVLVGVAIYGIYVKALKMLSYDDIALLSRLFPRPINRFVFFIGKLIASN